MHATAATRRPPRADGATDAGADDSASSTASASASTGETLSRVEETAGVERRPSAWLRTRAGLGLCSDGGAPRSSTRRARRNAASRRPAAAPSPPPPPPPAPSAAPSRRPSPTPPRRGAPSRRSPPRLRRRLGRAQLERERLLGDRRRRLVALVGLLDLLRRRAFICRATLNASARSCTVSFSRTCFIRSSPRGGARRRASGAATSRRPV